jgi:hypothetical protein
MTNANYLRFPVKAYIRQLSEELPELFFFAALGSPASSLKLFMLCYADITEVERRGKRIFVHLKARKLVGFLKRHYGGLNDMTEWLSMPGSDNKRISLAVRHFLFGDFASSK